MKQKGGTYTNVEIYEYLLTDILSKKSVTYTEEQKKEINLSIIKKNEVYSEIIKKFYGKKEEIFQLKSSII